MVSLFFINKLMVALVPGQDFPTEAQLPWLPDEVSEAESLLSMFEQNEEVLFIWISLRAYASVRQRKYTSGYDPQTHRLFWAGWSYQIRV